MICEECRRIVTPSHKGCGGDARATCVLYGCGRPVHAWRIREIGGTGARTTLGYCDQHDNGESE